VHRLKNRATRLVLRDLLLGLAVCLGAMPVLAQSAVNTGTNRYQFRQPHDPDGIGKFYLGREIAQVMGHEAAGWLERVERDQQEHTEELVEQLKIQPGQVVADIGAGTGYFSRRLAKRVGPAGKILAVDVQPEMIYLLNKNLAALRLTNVTAVLGTPTDPRLPPGSVDVVVMVDVYHEFEYPFEMMNRICATLKPGGRVAFVEYRSEPQIPIKPLHKMTEAQLRKEMAVQPLDWVETRHGLPWQDIVVFRQRER
jgi:ubiquinone/menaquinone biosynthesis C-methylase UbiE